VHEIISAVCGLNPDGTHGTLTQGQSISQIERRISAFYVGGHGGKRFDVMVAMDLRPTSTSAPPRMTNPTSFCFSRTARILLIRKIFVIRRRR